MENLQIIANEIKEIPLIKKHLKNNTWLSGSSTIVYPITISQYDITLQINKNKNIFNKIIKEIVEKYDELKYGYFLQSDGSCPNIIVFKKRGKNE